MTTFQSPKRHTLRHLAGAALLCALATTAAAQAWPTKAVSLVVPFPAGGTTDVLARALGQELAKSLGQPVIVENKPGAGATLGADFVAKAKPDGYTLLMGAVHHTIATSVYRKLAYDFQKDLAPVTTVAMVPNVLVVPAASPHKSLADVIAFHKAQPGKMTFASSGNGSSDHLTAELFWQQTNTSGVHVPYRGGGPVMTDLLGGQVDASFMNINTAMPQIQAGKLRALAITSAKRSPLLPQVQTLEEGGIKDANVYSWQAFAAPRGLPADVKAKLHAAIVAGLNDAQVKPKLLDLGFEIVANTPEQFAAYQAAEFARWKKLIADRNIKAD